jgi:hypothetical protein
MYIRIVIFFMNKNFFHTKFSPSQILGHIQLVRFLNSLMMIVPLMQSSLISTKFQCKTT